jgi:hypothetical protein
MAIRFLSSETIDGALTVNSTVTLNKTNNVINIPSLVDNGKFLQVTQVGNETWEFKCESLSGSLDGVTIGTTPGKVAFDENGQIQSIQLLDVATAGGRLTGFSNRGYLSSIHLEQTATNTDGGYIRFLTAASGTTSGLERFKITETGAFSVGPSGTNYGTSGQVLTSQGNALPTWTTPTTGTITGSGTADKVTKFTSATAIGDGPITFATNDSTFAGNIIIHNSSNAPYIDFVESGATTDSKARITMDQIDTDNATLRFSTEGAGTLSERMRIDENGNVAIQPGGATLTNTRLYVVSADNYDPSLYDGMGGIRIGSGGSSSAGDGNYTGGIGFAITSGTSGIAGVQKGADADKQGLAFFTHPSDTGGDAAVEKMRLDADGNLGIGTTSPIVPVHIVGTAVNNPSNGNGGYEVMQVFDNTSANIGVGGGIGLGGVFNSSGTDTIFSEIRGIKENSIDSNYAGALTFSTRTNGANITERMRITSAGDVGIGYSSPSYKLDVNGVTRTRGFLQESNIFEDVADTAYFTNATADQNVDIILGNISMWGYIEITITGTYSYQSTPGKLTKLYAVGLNSGGTIYENNSRIVDAIGPINGNIYLDDLRWDSTASQYRIRVAHIVSTGNQYSIKINAFSHSTGALNLAGWSISGLYTQSTSGLLAQNASYLNYLGIGTENATVQLQVERNTNSNHPMLFLDTTGGGSGCVGLNSSSAIGPYIEGNTNIDGTVRGAYEGSRMLFNAGGFTFQFSDETSGTRTFDSLMTIQGSTGNVGIGTTSPAQTLEIHNSDASDYTDFGLKGTGHKYVIGVGNDSVSTVNDKLYFYDNDNTAFRMVLDTSGNLGIGTTSPGAQLHNYSTSTQNVWLSGYGTLAQNTWGAGHGIFAAADNGLLISKANAANDTNRLFSFYHDAGGNAEMYMYNTSMTNTVKIDSSGVSYLNGGNVGIGTTAPTKKLEISGAGGSGGPLMRLNNTTGSGASGPTIDFGYSGQTWRVGANVFAAGDFAIYDTGNSTHLLLINNAGDFGIGTTNPGAISGGCTTMTFGSTSAALSGGVLFQANGTNVNGTYWESDNMRYQNIGDYSHTFYKNNSTVLFTIATTGTVTATGDVVAYSDERLKSDIKTLDGSKVLKMRGVSFKKEGKKGSGVIAQELEKIAPELVNNDSEYKGVAYGNLSGYLIEAIKEQQKQIDRLEEQIKKMSSKN